MTRDQYVRDVGHWLHDIPWSTRRDLLAELRGHLAELPADTDLETRLGSPEEYAAELRSAAGLERRRGPVAFLQARRPRNLVLALVTLAVIGLAIGAVAWIQSYQPIAFAGGGLDPVGAGVRAGLQGESVVFHVGRPFQFGITIENKGRFPVRVLDAPLPDGVPFSARLMMSDPLTDGGVHGPYVRFRPFDLRPGEVRLLFYKGVLACPAPGPNASVGFIDFPVRYSFLWRTKTAYIPLDEELAIVSPKGVRCPTP
ncbi:MAG TPA: hypothetical protein VGI69_05315 [Gaiellaceae bacterium]